MHLFIGWLDPRTITAVRVIVAPPSSTISSAPA
jgi:hypothetical protein